MVADSNGVMQHHQLPLSLKAMGMVNYIFESFILLIPKQFKIEPR
jgi:hypothetical protein